MRRRSRTNMFDVLGGMRAQQLFIFRQRRIAVLQIMIQSCSNQSILNGGKTVGALRMVIAHIVQPAIAVSNKRSRHEFQRDDLQSGEHYPSDFPIMTDHG